ncbi:alkaline phosphatase D family protein [uncultured Methylophaga sp.]|uniref:alkaline phosphatase D family protein n=1 Tax=uncultured Methylophaga sp. TaxID=285271 RepID=UPI00261B8710|nr:alkaline phosphatase D family protein [uncultured Methylophaga sp.]
MSSLRPAQLGPIVGHTTDTTSRIWIRGAAGDEGADVNAHRRTVGVIAITHENDRRPRKKRVYYFRLRREYDRTGTFTLGEEVGLKPADNRPVPLKPNTHYTVRVGTLHIDDPSPELDSMPHDALAERLPDAMVWFNDLERLDPELSEASFTTFPAVGNEQRPLSLLLGSCRYPGLLWKTRHSDAIFEPLLAEAQGRDGRPPVNMLLMVGDQIYADMLNRHIPLGLADTFEEFQERYHSAFGSRHMRKLLRQVPTYMILDDHEIEDNWHQDRIRRADSRRVFNLAINAYRSYQWVHGPTCYGDRLFYDFACSGYPLFVLDTRTQRHMGDLGDSLRDNHLLGRPSLSEEEPSQLDLLLFWLKQSQQKFGNAPKFIVSASVFAPSPIDARTGREGTDKQKIEWKEDSDSWPAFPNTREAILRTLIEHQIQNVVFLSGDIHCSNVAEIAFSGFADAEKIRAFSIVSSALYWPFPFADGEPSAYVHDSKAEGQEDSFEFSADGKVCKMDYRAWNFTQEDNFCRIDVDPASHHIQVTTFSNKGQILEAGGWFGLPGRPIQSQLKLAAW